MAFLARHDLLHRNQDVDDIRRIVQTACEHGLSGMVLSAGLDRLDLQPPYYFERLGTVKQVCVMEGIGAYCRACWCMTYTLWLTGAELPRTPVAIIMAGMPVMPVVTPSRSTFAFLPRNPHALGSGGFFSPSCAFSSRCNRGGWRIGSPLFPQWTCAGSHSTQ